MIDAPAVLAWYDRHARDLPWRVGPAGRAGGISPDPYRVWLSEIMLQQTTVGAVTQYFARFIRLWPTIADLAAAPLHAVLVEWAGLGYYARARNLHACATRIVAEHDGRFPGTAAALQTLPGIGPYTGAAIAAIVHDEPVAVVDGNVERVVARYLALERPAREAKAEIRALVQASVPSRAGDFAQALMDLGATLCAPRSVACGTCPLSPGCAASRSGDPLAYPVKAEKPARPVRHGHAFVVVDADGDVFLRSRRERGLLAGMTEVPGSDWLAERAPPAFPFAADWRKAGEVVHVFTHFRLELDVWSAIAPDPARLCDGWWSDPGALGAEALPSVFRKVLATAGHGRPE